MQRCNVGDKGDAGPAAALPWDHPQPFTVDVEVHPEDIDELDHANNAAYLRWLEQVAWAHSSSLGLDWAAYRELGVGCVVHRHELDYLAATFAGETLSAATWVTSNDGRLTLWRDFQIIRHRDRATVLRAKSRFVCVRLASGRPCRMPQVFRERYRVTV